MADSAVVAQLRAVTDRVLDEMQQAGWFREASRVRCFDRPTEWDINCGWCCEWAETAVETVGGAMLDIAELGMDEEEWAHYVLVLDGRIYDAQDPDGVESVEALHLVRGVTRAEWLATCAERPRSLLML
jgi:hypothetical protein